MNYKGEIITELSEQDIGKWITYVNVIDGNETGKLKSFNNETQTAFIVFKCDDNWDLEQRKDYTAQSCSYKDLAF